VGLAAPNIQQASASATVDESQYARINLRHAFDDGSALHSGLKHGDPAVSPSNATQAGSTPALGDALGQRVG